MTAARRVLAAVLVLAALAWLPLNKSVEGPTLLVLTRHHGVTAADLLSVAAVLLAVWLAWPRASDRRPTPSRPVPPPPPVRSPPVPPRPADPVRDPRDPRRPPG